MRPIVYANGGDALVEAIPTLRSAYEEELQWWGSERPGAHTVITDVLTPYLLHLARVQPESPELISALDFVERLASDPDPAVQELVPYSVCEQLADDTQELRVLIDRMGPATFDWLRRVQRLWKRRHRVLK